MLIVLLVAGLLLLAAGGEALVRRATTIAMLVHLTPAVIGLTVVAMGTSFPELVVSMLAGLRGQPDIAVANVVGSNIFNVTATLGVAAMVRMLPVRGNAVRLEWPFMFLATCAAMLVLRDGEMDRVEGAIFLAALVLFTVHAVTIARKEVTAHERAEFADAVQDRVIAEQSSRSRELIIAIGLVLGGMVALIAGGRLLLDGAVGLARFAGMSERVIGLTVVAAGTSMPELAASVVAARRGQADLAVANLIGSNIFNILGILGLTAVIQPIRPTSGAITADLWWMAGTALLLYPVMLRGMRVSRAEGAFLVAVYLLYTTLLLG